MVEDAAVLRGVVGRLRLRIRLLVAQQWVCLGVTGGLLFGLLLVACTRLRWWTDAQDYIGAFLLVGGVIGFLIGWNRRITPMTAAMIADERAGLKERLSTAVALSDAGSTSEMAQAQVRDAARHAAELQAGQVLPWRVPPQWRWLAVASAVLAAAVFLPDLPLFQSLQDRVDRETMKVEGARLKHVAKALEKKAAGQRKGEEENNALLRRVAQNMRQLGKEMDQGRIPKKQALLKMNDLLKEMKQAENQARPGGNNPRKDLDQVMRDLQAQAQKAGEKGNQEGARSLSQMAEAVKNRDFDEAKRQLEELAKKIQSGKMNSQEAAQAGEALKQMARAMEGSGLDAASKQMKEASRQLEKAAELAKQFQKQLDQASSDAERQQLQQAMQQAVQQATASAAQQCQKAGGT